MSIFLTGERVNLQTLEGEDAHCVALWHNDAELKSLIMGRRLPVSLEKEREWIQLNSQSETALILGIEYEGKLIGIVRLMNIDWVDSKAELGIFIGEAEGRGQGLGQDATRTLLKYAFEILPLNKVYLRVLVDNARALRTFAKCGFRREGVLRMDYRTAHGWTDVAVMSILREEYLGLRA